MLMDLNIRVSPATTSCEAVEAENNVCHWANLMEGL